MEIIFSDICKYMETKVDYFDTFIRYRMRYEGWLEAEILKFIDDMENVKIISTKKKYKIFSRRPDLVLQVDNATYLVEIKACLIEKSPQVRGIPFYFKTQLIKDFTNISQSIDNELALVCFCPCRGSRDPKFVKYKNEIEDKLKITMTKEFNFITPSKNDVTLSLWKKK